MNEVLTFIRTKQRRSNVMTSARIQPFCRKYNINRDYFEGLEHVLEILQKDIQP